MARTLLADVWSAVEIFRYVVAALLIFIAVSLANDYWRSRALAPLLASTLYVVAAVSSLALFSWWPLVAALVVAAVIEKLETRRARDGSGPR